MSSDERRVIDHPLFQRLRRIRQTAFLYQVFPGATHDRFSHSLGAMHMAGLTYDNIAEEFTESFGARAFQPSQRDYFRRLLRLSALLHDVGHGPFSHSLEGVTHAGRPIHPSRKDFLELGDVPDHWIDPKGPASKPKWRAGHALHEEFSIAIIAKMADENGRIGGLEAQDIAAMLTDWIVPTDEFRTMDKVGPSGKWHLRRALKSMVSGELDCDRMDYLLRDSHYTGVPYGSYDREMLLGNILWRPDPEKPNDLIVSLRRKALHAFEDFLISRYHMFLQLYSHKTAVGFDVILENALAELPEFTINPDLEDYVTWTDDWLLRRILENRSSRWGQHIRDREPLKHLFTVRQEDQKAFTKFIGQYETSRGTTVWFPSLKNRLKEKPAKNRDGEIPKLWWRQCTSILTKGEKGHYPIWLDDRGKLVPLDGVSHLLRSDYVQRVDILHVYCLRGEEKKVLPWLLSAGVPASILSKPKSLLGH
jgi:uncharacterized protein